MLIQIKLTDYMTNSQRLRSLIKRLFDLELPYNQCDLILTPEQFATFIVERNNRGINNDTKAIEPKIIQREPLRQTIDVSKRGA